MKHLSRGSNRRARLSLACAAMITAALAAVAGCASEGTGSAVTETLAVQGYPIVGTSQAISYDDKGEIADPAKGEPFYGQDSQHAGNAPAYIDNGDGTISDAVTGLMWVKDRGSTITWADAAKNASADRTGGYSDWRMPSIKELYSLIRFDGVNGHDNMSTTGFQPFIDTAYFGFAYGSGKGQERVIDCQDW